MGTISITSCPFLVTFTPSFICVLTGGFNAQHVTTFALSTKSAPKSVSMTKTPSLPLGDHEDACVVLPLFG